MLHLMWNILLELSPWMLLGMAIAGLMHIWLPADFVQRHLGSGGGVTKAVALGVPMPLCSCGVIPAGLGLKKDGASDAAAVAFLVSTPQTGVDSILVSASFLGWPFALFKVASAALTGWVAGTLTEAFGGPTVELVDDVRSAAPTGDPRGWREGFDHGLTLLRTIWRWLVFGVFASALLTLYLPPSVYTELQEQGPLVAMLGTLVISLPLYVCATASVPIAAALVAGGLPAGAALVFLMAGPATNVATIGAILRGFGPRVLGIYLATIILGSMGCGLAFGGVIDTVLATDGMHMSHTAWWQIGSALVLVGLMGWFALGEALRALRPAPKSGGAILLPVTGMTCGGCVARLERSLRQVEGAEQVFVTLEPGQAEVHGPVTEATLRQVISEAGFGVP
jgi:uncharacterized membrane protein YraQ (UPF0718 family)/copper chaperone CopZ